MAAILLSLLKSLSSSSFSTSSGSIVVWLGLSLAIANAPISSASAAVLDPVFSSSSAHFIDLNSVPESAIAPLSQEQSESKALANHPVPAVGAIASTTPAAQPLQVSLQPRPEADVPAAAGERSASEPPALESSAPLLSASLSVPNNASAASVAIAAASPAESNLNSASQLASSALAVSSPASTVFLPEANSVAAAPVAVAPSHSPSTAFIYYPATPPPYAVAQTLPYAPPVPLVSVALPGQPTAQSFIPNGAVPVFNSATGSYVMMMPVPVAVPISGSSPASTFSYQAPAQAIAPMGGISSPMAMNSGYNPYAQPGFSSSGSAAFNPVMMPNPYVPAQYSQTAYGQASPIYGQAPIAYGQPYGQSQNPYITAPYGQAPVMYGQAPYGQTAYAQAPIPYGQAPYGQAPYGQAPYGQAPYGQAPYGQAPYGQAPYGQAPYGQAPYGQAPYGQAPYAQAPTGYQGSPPLAVPSVPTGNRATTLPPPPLQGQAIPTFPGGYPAAYPTGNQGTPVLAPLQFQQAQQPTYVTPGAANQLTPTAPTYPYPGNPLTAPAALLRAPGQESLARRAPITSPSIQLQGGFIYQGDDFSGRARVSVIYPFSPNVLVGGILDFASGPAITSTDDEGVNLNELYLAASLDDLPNLRLLVGQLDLTSYFDRNSFAKDSLTHFLNPVFQTNPALAAAAIGSRPGALLNWSLSDNLEVKAAAFSSDRSITDFALDGFAGEIGFRTGNFILRGTYTSSVDGGQRSGFQEAFSVTRQAGGFGVQDGDREDAYGVNAELFIPDLNMGLFARYGQYTNQDLDLNGDTYSAGVNFLDLFTPGDRLGVGYGRSLSNDRLRVQAGTEMPDVLEVFYDLQLQRNLRMGFSFQQLNEFSESVAGIRVRADFDVSPRGAL